jgi:hypothetical protein
VALFGVALLYAIPFLGPYGLLAAALTGVHGLWAPALAGVGANVALRALLAWRHRQPLEGMLLHPIAVSALLAVAINSWRWTAAGTIRWRGRTYPSRALRDAS